MEEEAQDESNLDARWVQGVPDRPSDFVTAVGTPPEKQKPLVFHLNTKMDAHWFYDWESGANKAQRLMKHTLRGYVLERCAVNEDGDFVDPSTAEAKTQLYRVLHVVTSPEFTVISYRRAPSEFQQYARDKEFKGAYPYGEADSIFDRAHSLSHMTGTMKLSAHLLRDARDGPVVSSHRAKRQRVSDYPPRSRENYALLDDKLRWEYANPSSAVVCRNVALLYSFLRWTPLNAYASSADELVYLLHINLKQSLSGFSNEISRLNCFSKLVFDQVEADQATTVASSFIHGSRIPNGPPSSLPREMGALLNALTQATLWLFSMETRQWVRGFFMKHAESVLDKYALRTSFVMFVRQLEDRLNHEVLERTELRSLDNVAEEVIAAVYSYAYFHERGPRVREILSGQNFAGWNAFVAQLRETYISLSEHPSVSRALVRRYPNLDFDEAHPPRNSAESAWNAEWMLDVDEAVWKFSDVTTKRDVGDNHVGDDDGSISLFSLLEIISFMVRLEVGIDVQARTLHVRSTLGVAGPLDCMRMVMDSKERVFSMFSNGMASGVEAGAYGDYIAEMQVEHSKRLVVYLQLFKWSVREDGSSYHVRMRIGCWQSRRLCISGDVLITTAPVSFTSEETPYVGEMSLRNKCDAVDRSFAWQLRENPTAEWAVSGAAPWKELGRFRLSYVKA